MTAPANHVILDYDFHPPQDMRIFSVPSVGVLRHDDEALVYQVRDDRVILRHYAFARHWFKVNCTTDATGDFIETAPQPDAPAFTFNCDISTPMLRRGRNVHAVDLWLDVLVRADGIIHEVCDEDEFADAIGKGWLSDREANGARDGLGALLEIITRGQLVSFLQEVCPFGRADAPVALPMRRVDPADVPLLEPGTRPTW